MTPFRSDPSEVCSRSWRSPVRRLIAATVTCCLLARATAAGQEQTGSVEGVVRDVQGGVLPGAAVTVSNDNGLTLEIVTDAAGGYRYPALPPGRYQMARMRRTTPGTARARRAGAVYPGRLRRGARSSRRRRSPTSPMRTASPSPSPSSGTAPRNWAPRGRHHMLFVSPTVEVGALDHRPVPFEPRPHQRVAADHLQVCNVLRPEKFVRLAACSE